MAAFGFTINTLSMFGLVLAIGLLVDDAIVVVENVERVMSEEGASPYDATRKGHGADHGPLVRRSRGAECGVRPDGLLGRVGGSDLPEFSSLTIVSAMFVVGIVALSLTPALWRGDVEAGGRGRGSEKGILRRVQSRVRAGSRQVPGRRTST